MGFKTCYGLRARLTVCSREARFLGCLGKASTVTEWCAGHGDEGLVTGCRGMVRPDGEGTSASAEVSFISPDCLLSRMLTGKQREGDKCAVSWLV